MRAVFLVISVLTLMLPPAHSQSCSLGSDSDELAIEFTSEVLRCEQSGFFPYVMADDATPVVKYQTESITGNGEFFYNGGGWLAHCSAISYSGSWIFSTSDFTNTSSKTANYNYTDPAIPAEPRAQTEIKAGFGNNGITPHILPSFVTSNTQTQRKAIDGSAAVPGGSFNWDWGNTDATETLSDEFTPAHALARANASPPLATGTGNTQQFGPFSPATWGAAKTLSRTSPISAPVQRVKFRVKLPPKPCGGEYKLVLTFAEWPYGQTEPNDPLVEPTTLRTVVSNETIRLDKKIETHWPLTPRSYEEVGISLRQGFKARLLSAKLYPVASCMPAGDGSFGVGSVEFSLSLGRLNAQKSAGSITLISHQINAGILTPKALQLTADSTIVPLRGSDGSLRQVAAPEVFVDIVTQSATAYEIRSYLPAQAGPANPVTGIQPVTGSPLKVFVFTGDVSGSNPSFIITPSDNPSRAATYTWNTTTGSLSMAQLGGMRVESVTETTSGATTTETRTIQDADSQIVSQISTVTTSYPFGRMVTSRSIGAAFQAQTTGTSYYTTPSDTANYGRIQQVTEPSGNWTRYTYDTQGRVLTKISRHLSNTGTAAASHRLIATTYETLSDQDGDSLPEELVTSVEKTLNIETARSYEVRFTATETYNTLPTKRVHFIQAVAQGAAWDASANLVSVSRTVASGPYADKPASSLSPDGTLTTYAYSTNATSGEVTTLVETGPTDLSALAVLSGTRWETLSDSFGRTLGQITTDIATSSTLESYVITETDDFGRHTRIDYADGTFELSDYACCGLASTTDRQGVTTHYEYDPLGRLERTTRHGLTARYTYDAAGRRLKTIRIGTDESEIIVEDNTYDTAGRIIETRDALHRPTTTAHENLFGGGYRTLVVAPDGGTITTTLFPDGRVQKIEGTAAAWSTFSYAVNPDGTHTTTEYSPAALITDTATWRRTTTDFLGRIVAEATPVGAGFRFHDPLGRLIRQTDPDGVQTLYAYDDNGDLTTTAFDVNLNGVIDYAGPDRITRTISTYATRLLGSTTVPVRRTTTEIWETPGVDTPVTISTTDTTLDGRQTWQTSRGLTTHAATTYAATGDFTTVTTIPDGTTQTRVTLQGRPASVLLAHPDLGNLSATTYDYDPQGRLRHVYASTGTTTYAWFDDDQPQSVTTPDPDTTRAGPGYDPQTTAYRYDSAGRLDRVTHPDATETFTTYWPTGQVKRTWGSRAYPQEYTYDQQQRIRTLVTWQDFSGDTGKATTTWTYDTPTGRLEAKSDHANQGADYTYTPAGRLLTRQWARSVAGQRLLTTYGYNPAGDLAAIDYADATPDVAYTYDRLGRLSTTTDAAGLLTRNYENGRLDDEVYTGVGHLAGRQIIRTQDSFQRPQSFQVSGFGPELSYTYDAASRLRTITQGGRIATQDYHATRGHPETVSITQGGVPRLAATRALDNLGRITSLVAPGVASAAYEYNAANQRIKATREDGAYWDYGYDALGQVTSAVKRHADASARPGHAYGYEFDDIGNRLETSQNDLEAIHIVNPINQYLGRTTPPAIAVLGLAAPATTVKVNHEIAANRVGEWFYHELGLDESAEAQYLQFPVSAAQLLGDPATSELVRSETRRVFVPASPETYVHDLDGNLTQDGRYTYAWDAENRLAQMETRADLATSGLPRERLSFDYDAQGRRIAKRVLVWSPLTSTFILSSETSFLYDGWNLAVEITPSGSPLRSYAWGLDVSGSLQGAGGVGGLLWATTGADSYAPAYDGNGNVIAWQDLATGQVVAKNDYGPFGEPIPVSGSNPTPFGFSTKYTDAETALVYYGFRYYNPSTGRWLSRDPIEESGGVNLYGMVRNNAVNLWDYLGLEDCVPYEPRFFTGNMFNNSSMASSTSISGHLSPMAPLGMIATERAGFIDVGHVRHNMDKTLHYYNQLVVASGGTGVVPAGTQLKGSPGLFRNLPFKPQTVLSDVTVSNFASQAARLAQLESWNYELNDSSSSSFSPEDVPSNFIGAMIAQRFLETKKPGDCICASEWAQAMDYALRAFLKHAKGVESRDQAVEYERNFLIKNYNSETGTWNQESLNYGVEPIMITPTFSDPMPQMVTPDYIKILRP